MVGAVLVVVLVLVLGGCVCVVWAERGGPGWVRLAARATLGAGELVRRAERRRRRRGISDGPDGGGD
ncbi:hypothetical protein Kpho02_65860 [Kitasatospora phosalacinea]|uniref:Uncharacterized protein n=1 Tax=Kitasatospora phosalacinea TaxID=2065 RepID=A0A9W6QG90_9ACTN|nr:hypothetical protein [Kitasatospora phosalacinea]GLW74288.1 hypothetical protein Kpho02_65860 [Kitasatospora phosalacinea]